MARWMVFGAGGDLMGRKTAKEIIKMALSTDYGSPGTMQTIKRVKKLMSMVF